MYSVEQTQSQLLCQSHPNHYLYNRGTRVCYIATAINPNSFAVTTTCIAGYTALYIKVYTSIYYTYAEKIIHLTG